MDGAPLCPAMAHDLHSMSHWRLIRSAIESCGRAEDDQNVAIQDGRWADDDDDDDDDDRGAVHAVWPSGMFEPARIVRIQPRETMPYHREPTEYQPIPIC